ncbi:hypothetical protein QL285_077011 [Trifolium repens]|nr:hypothetical protein QL285_077011 [Trifolium repens]
MIFHEPPTLPDNGDHGGSPIPPPHRDDDLGWLLPLPPRRGGGRGWSPPLLQHHELIMGRSSCVGELTISGRRLHSTACRPRSGFPAKFHMLNFLDHLLGHFALGL